MNKFFTGAKQHTNQTISVKPVKTNKRKNYE